MGKGSFLEEIFVGKSLFSVFEGVLFSNNSFGERLNKARNIKGYKIVRRFLRVPEPISRANSPKFSA